MGSLPNPTELIVIESKQLSSSGTAKLNSPSKNGVLPAQMSNKWLKYIAEEKLNKLTGPANELKRLTGEAVNKYHTQILFSKYVVVVNKTTKEIYFLKLANY